ncbi:MAG: hypothetical protein KDD25_05105, partial [Bdellovibrionales bacterium]|nr:hypothetical protein [Bdellovibrionales bacterium]
RVSFANYEIRGNQSIEQIMSRVRDLLEQSRAENAKLIVFPELWILDALDFSRDERPQFDRIIREFVPPVLNLVSNFATENNIYIQAGSFPVYESEDVYNRSFFFFPDGRKYEQDKVFITPDEKYWGWKEGNKIHVLNTPWGRTVTLTCYDAEIPIVSSKLASADIQLLLVPSMTDASGKVRVAWTSQSRAIEHKTYVAVSGVASRSGNPWELVGQNLVVGPSQRNFPFNEIANRSVREEGVSLVDLDFGHLERIRTSGGVFPAQDQRIRNENEIEVINDENEGEGQ